MDKTGGWAEPRFNALPVSTGYMNGVSYGPIGKVPGPYWTVKGNGGIIATVDDTLHWYRALRGSEVLSPASTDAMFTSYTTAGGVPIDYGYGWEISDHRGLGRLITHNGGGFTGNAIISNYVDQNLLIIILGNHITYRTLGALPLVIGLPADETSRAIAENILSGDFSKLPTTTFVIWPYLGGLVAVLAAVAAALVWLRVRSRRTTVTS